MRKGVLLMAYGAPTSIGDVEAYYTDIRRGRKPSPEATAELCERYRAIGGQSPLLQITQRQAGALQQQLHGIPVYVGMRHWHPFIADAVRTMQQDGIEEVVGMAMSPYYSRMSIGAYMRACEDACNQYALRYSCVQMWYRQPALVQAWDGGIRVAAGRIAGENSGAEPVVVFTAHSLPTRIEEWNDPYPSQLGETAETLANSASIGRWEFAFQSAGRTSEPWLGPDMTEVLQRLAAEKVQNILVAPIGFVADHLEVLYDIDVEAAARARTLGMKLQRVPSLNTHPLLIQAMAQALEEYLQ